MKLALIVLVASLATSATDPQLHDELLHRVEIDQAARRAMVDWVKANGGVSAVGSNLTSEQRADWKQLTSRIEKIDTDNTKWLKTVLDKHGWPSNSLVSKDGANAAWLLIQHADADTKFQRRCLDLMAKLPKGEVALQSLAYLTDRVLLAEGKKQLYGTQFAPIDGKLQPQPIEDEANVDARRAQVGLPPLAEYARFLESQFRPANN